MGCQQFVKYILFFDRKIILQNLPHQSNNLALHNDCRRQDCYSGIASLGMRGHRLFTRVIIIVLEDMETQFPTPTEPVITEDQNCISIEEARDCIKTKFLSYHQLLDERESKLISELNQLEETNKPELTQVRHDINQLTEVSKYLDESLGANTLKLFLKEQKSILIDQILHFQRSEKLLSHVILKFSEIESSIKNVINIIPFWSKAKFRNELKPFLELEEQVEDSYPVSNDWFSEFANSIHLKNPKPNDSWEFPVKIPIQTSSNRRNTGNVKMLHSKAWDMLLAFNGLSPCCIPTKNKSHSTSVTRGNQLPINAIKHKCIFGHNDGNNKFSFECEFDFLPHDTYEDVVKKISGFSALFTSHTPILYTFNNTQTASCNPPHFTSYTITKRGKQCYSDSSNRSGFDFPKSKRDSAYTNCKTFPLEHVQITELQIGPTDNVFLIIIPDSDGRHPFSVSTYL